MIHSVLYADGEAKPIRDGVATDDEHTQWYDAESTNEFTNRMFGIQILLKVIYLLTMLYYTNATRKAWSTFRETKFLIFHGYIIVFLFMIMGVVATSISAKAIHILFMFFITVMLVSLLLLYTIPLFMNWLRDSDDEPVMVKCEQRRYETSFHQIINHLSIDELKHALAVIQRVHTFKVENHTEMITMRKKRSSAYFYPTELEEAKTVWKFAEEIRRASMTSVEALSEIRDYVTQRKESPNFSNFLSDTIPSTPEPGGILYDDLDPEQNLISYMTTLSGGETLKEESPPTTSCANIQKKSFKAHVV